MHGSKIAWFTCLWLFGVIIAHADQPVFPSPDGRYIIATEKNEEPQSYHVNLIDAKSHKVLDSYNPETRAIEAFWNSTSKMVAINEDISHATGNLSLFRVVAGRLESVTLPRKLRWEDVKDGDGIRQVDAITHFIPAADVNRIKIWNGAHQPWAIGWLNATDLNVDIGGVAQLEGNYELAVEYEVVLHIVPPRISILSETRKKYEISEEKSN